MPDKSQDMPDTAPHKRRMKIHAFLIATARS